MDFLDRIRTRAEQRRRGVYLGERIGKGWCFLQDDLVVANAPGATVRGDINNQLQSLGTLMSGASAPATTYAYMLWADTTSNTLKRRNGANAAWIVVRSLDESFILARSSNTILGLSDIGKTVRYTSTFTHTVTAVATLADGWWIDFINEGTGVITFDPNASETIGGQTTLAVGPGESGRIVCNGSNLQVTLRSRYAGAIAAGRNIASKNNAATPNTKIDITTDELQLKDANGNAKVALSVSVTIDYGVTGANGIDTGTQAASTWYYNWVIAKEDGTVAGLGSLSSTAPTMPSGYTYKALVNAARSNGSTQFIKYRQFGNTAYYEARQSVLSSGSATTETAISTATVAPPNALTALFCARVFHSDATGTGGNVVLRFISGSDFHGLPMGANSAGNSEDSASQAEIPNVGQNVYYLWSSALSGRAFDLYVEGFKLPLGGE